MRRELEASTAIAPPGNVRSGQGGGGDLSEKRVDHKSSVQHVDLDRSDGYPKSCKAAKNIILPKAKITRRAIQILMSTTIERVRFRTLLLHDLADSIFLSTLQGPEWRWVAACELSSARIRAEDCYGSRGLRACALPG